MVLVENVFNLVDLEINNDIGIDVVTKDGSQPIEDFKDNDIFENQDVKKD